MGLGDIVLILAIALILFGPEDLPEIARKIGKIVYEIRKAGNELTREFQTTLNTPSDVLNKALEPMKPRVVEKESHIPNKENGEQKIPQTEPELLTYDDELVKESSQGKKNDPLAELPSDMVSYEEKGASR